MFKLIVWDFFGKFANQIIAFGVSILLARLLDPAEFGIVGIALALVGFATVFYDFGLKASVVQAEQVTPRQLSTIFYINLLAGGILFLLCYASSSSIERFYNIEGLAEVVIAIGLLLVLNAMSSLPMGLLARNLQFKKMATINFVAALIAGCMAVVVALKGGGVWSLITNTLLHAFLVLTSVFWASGWKPSLTFDLKSIKPLWRFGSTVFGIEALESFFSRIDVFLIGKIFQASTLGFYTRAQSLDGMVKQFSSGSLVAVVLPYFSRKKGQQNLLNDYYIQSLHVIAFGSLFLTGVLYTVSIELFTFLFTAKWAFAGELFQIIALSGFAYPVSALMVNVILSMGRTKAIVRLELLKKLVLLPVFLFGNYFGIKGFLYALVSAYWATVLLNAFFVSKVIAVPFKMQMNILGRYVFISFISASLTIITTNWMDFSPLLIIFLRGSIFLLLYLLLNHVSKTAGILLIMEKSLSALKSKGILKTV